MKRLHILIFGVVIFSQVAFRSVRAESIGFTRTDSNNASASTQGSLTDLSTLTTSQAYNANYHNSLATTSATDTASFPNGSYQFLGLGESFNACSTSQTTYTPNISGSGITNLGWDGTNIELFAGSSGSVISTYQLNAPVDPNINTIVVSGTVKLNTGATPRYYRTTLGANGTIGNVHVAIRFSDIDEVYEVTVHEGSTLVWSDTAAIDEAIIFHIDFIATPSSSINFRSGAGGGIWAAGTLSWYDYIIAASAEAQMTATGHNSAVDPPGFSGTRVYMQRIVDDEEEQDPPVLVYDSEG